MSRKIEINPVSRVEGHGKVVLQLSDEGAVESARLHIIEFRGFEKFVQGRPFWEMPTLTERLCGICPVSHHLAAAKACDMLINAKLTPAADKIRRLMHYGQIYQSHALHFFHLSSADFLLGFDSDPALRNVIGVAGVAPDVALKAIKMRKFGQEIIKATGGKKIHPNGAIPGGMNVPVLKSVRDNFLTQIKDQIQWSIEGVELCLDFYKKNIELFDTFASFESCYMGSVGENGELELYDGKFRGTDKNGEIVFDQVPYENYLDVIAETVEKWSYMKFPYFTKIGYPEGSYRVGPLARFNVSDSIGTPEAAKYFAIFKEIGGGKPVEGSLFYHFARLVEMLHSAEMMEILLNDDDILSNDLMNQGELQKTGIGVIEAPRGTLIHHYEVDENGLLEKMNLIVATTQNNVGMNTAVETIAKQFIQPGVEVTEGILNRLEVGIRCYDPCLSCATHALGQMPMRIEVLDSSGEIIQVVSR